MKKKLSIVLCLLLTLGQLAMLAGCANIGNDDNSKGDSLPKGTLITDTGSIELIEGDAESGAVYAEFMSYPDYKVTSAYKFTGIFTEPGPDGKPEQFERGTLKFGTHLGGLYAETACVDDPVHYAFVLDGLNALEFSENGKTEGEEMFSAQFSAGAVYTFCSDGTVIKKDGGNQTLFALAGQEFVLHTAAVMCGYITGSNNPLSSFADGSCTYSAEYAGKSYELSAEAAKSVCDAYIAANPENVTLRFAANIKTVPDLSSCIKLVAVINENSSLVYYVAPDGTVFAKQTVYMIQGMSQYIRCLCDYTVFYNAALPFDQIKTIAGIE